MGRDERLSAIFIGIQAAIRVRVEKSEFVHRLFKREAARTIQSNIRSFLYVRDWEWMKIMYKIKPLLQSAEAAKEMEEVMEEFESMKISYEKETKRRKELEEAQISLIQEKNDLALQLASEQDTLNDSEERCDQLIRNKIELEGKV